MRLHSRKCNWKYRLKNGGHCVSSNVLKLICPLYASVNQVSIGSGNDLSSIRRQAAWTNAALLSIGPLAANFNEILIETLTFS